ncbi:thioesterase II family protein [Streptomyces luteireticuli]|uniref:thioesterase II family protein n=1 Tax=Streptomyces luteireticuli TaxID=173858 RepID=UPI00355668E5
MARPLGDGLLWELTPEPVWTGADAAVLLLPGVGGTTGDFALWTRHLAPAFRVLTARYPGRDRTADPLPGPAGLAAALAHRVVRHVPEPLLILGHSMGAVIGYETACRLARHGRPALALHACAAFSPPEYAAFDLNTRTMDDDALTDLARTLAIPLPREERAQQRHDALRAVRADLALIDAYDCGPRPRPLEYPVTVWSGRDDTVVPAASAHRWQSAARHPLTHHTLPVAHHCLTDRQAIEPITRALRAGARSGVG